MEHPTFLLQGICKMALLLSTKELVKLKMMIFKKAEHLEPEVEHRNFLLFHIISYDSQLIVYKWIRWADGFCLREELITEYKIIHINSKEKNSFYVMKQA